MINGIIIVSKEQEYTSHDVVAKMRGICRQKKIGHTGTLDPNATGVLPVCLGNATKLCDMLTDHDKEYIAEFELGKISDTLDIWGEVTVTDADVSLLTEETVKQVIYSMEGDQMQVPPMYSAKKIDGKKLYELARAGIEVERKAVPIHVSEMEILEMALPKVVIRVACSKGTYIRSICADIGEKLGCGAVMTALERTKAGMFLKENSYSLAQIQTLRDENRLEEIVIPVETCFEQYERILVKPFAEKMLKNGNELHYDMLTKIPTTEKCRICDAKGQFYGVFLAWNDKKTVKPWKMFLPEEG
ncbi:MAG: tRNA pseudouridine(55) synthase TruB [Lachnospiraceae bacterium]|nr:tRNA pseudouridine(55) synthase TruB [Lachnospiraceae bacterium]